MSKITNDHKETREVKHSIHSTSRHIKISYVNIVKCRMLFRCRSLCASFFLFSFVVYLLARSLFCSRVLGCRSRDYDVYCVFFSCSAFTYAAWSSPVAQMSARSVHTIPNNTNIITFPCSVSTSKHCFDSSSYFFSYFCSSKHAQKQHKTQYTFDHSVRRTFCEKMKFCE